MDYTFGLAALALFVIVGALFILAGVGGFVLWLAAWRNFTRWIAASHLAEERHQAKSRLKRERKIAAEREEAMLQGASAVATKMVQTVVETQLQYLASREVDFRQQVLQMALLVARNHNMPNVLAADTQNPSRVPLEASPMMTQGKPQPHRRGLIARVKSMFIADDTSSEI